MKSNQLSCRLVCEISFLFVLIAFIQKPSFSQNHNAKASLRGTVTTEGNVVVDKIQIVAFLAGEKSAAGRPIPAVVNKNNGKYRIEKINAGDYILKISGKFIKTKNERAKILPGNSNWVDIKVECTTKRTALRGKLFDRSGAPLRNARVALYLPDLPSNVCERCFVDEAISNEHGEIVYNDLGAGETYYPEIRLKDKSSTKTASVLAANSITLGWDTNTQIELQVNGAQVVAKILPVVPGPEDQKRKLENASIPQGEKRKIQGVVSMRSGDSFKVRGPEGAETTVLLSPDTKVTLHGPSNDEYAVTYLMRGLRLQAQGRGDAEGNLVAEWVRFDEQDLRSAQALEQTDAMAVENHKRLVAAEQTAREAAEEAKRMAGQIAENTALANEARQKAEAAQRTADQAFKDAALANNRINGLDDYEIVRTIAVLFKVNSSMIDATAKRTMDEAAAWARADKAKGNTNGWLVQVVGFADTTGKTAKNRALSERRAKAVIQYLVGVHNLDLRRLIQPFGYGESNPAADNKTAAGRAKYRRVEITILQNKGIAMKGD